MLATSSHRLRITAFPVEEIAASVSSLDGDAKLVKDGAGGAIVYYIGYYGNIFSRRARWRGSSGKSPRDFPQSAAT
jgi:hypothetical protein